MHIKMLHIQLHSVAFYLLSSCFYACVCCLLLLIFCSSNTDQKHAVLNVFECPWTGFGLRFSWAVKLRMSWELEFTLSDVRTCDPSTASSRLHNAGQSKPWVASINQQFTNKSTRQTQTSVFCRCWLQLSNIRLRLMYLWIWLEIQSVWSWWLLPHMLY